MEEKEKRVAELEATLGEVCGMCVDIFWCLGKLIELLYNYGQKAESGDSVCERNVIIHCCTVFHQNVSVVRFNFKVKISRVT